MLSDRPYMRNDYPRERTSVLTWMLAAVLGAFALELALVSPWFRASDQLMRGIAVTVPGLSSGWLWTLVTHGLLHSQDNLFHVVVVAAGLFVVGRELEPLIGQRRLGVVFVGALMFGAVTWAAVNWSRGGLLIGGMAGVYGLLVLFAALQPNREFSLLLFFFFPITLRVKHVALALLALDLAAFASFEVLGQKLPLDYTPSAHLGGMMFGWIYFRYLYRREGGTVKPRRTSSSVAAAEAAADQEVEVAAPLSPLERRAHLRAEVDRILDKINSHGLGSLTLDEKRRLDEAKQTLGRR